MQAIRDGVIDGELDHEARALTSREIANVYATKEPQEAFHRRIEFCLDVHNQAVRVSSCISHYLNNAF
jgi:26S proteasome regulatory subunit N3